MFGFLTAPCSTCDQANHSIYRSYFCGLSTRLARDYGQSARFLTNRDSTFISLFTAAQSETPPSGESITCCNPFGATHPLHGNETHARYAAAVTICGLNVRLEDAADDEGVLKGSIARVATEGLNPWVDRALGWLEHLGFPHEAVKQSMASQTDIEQSAPRTWKQAADPTQDSFGRILAHSSEMELPLNQAPATDIGQTLGRLIYLLDAVEDLPEDQQKGRYNPFRDFTWSESFAGRISADIDAEITRLRTAFAQLKLRRNANLVESILLDGVASQADGVLQMASGQSPEKSRKNRSKKRNNFWENCKDSCCSSFCDCDCCGRSGGKADCCDCDCCPCDCSC